MCGVVLEKPVAIMYGAGIAAQAVTCCSRRRLLYAILYNVYLLLEEAPLFVQPVVLPSLHHLHEHSAYASAVHRRDGASTPVP